MPDDWVIFNFKDKCNFIKGKKPKKIYKFHENNTGSAIPHVDKGFILNLQLALPKDSKYIQNIFQQIHNKIINNNEEIESLRKLRDTLLPKLMSGEIDVSQVEV